MKNINASACLGLFVMLSGCASQLAEGVEQNDSQMQGSMSLRASLAWTNASCTPAPGASNFHVEVTGLSSGEVAEFSLNGNTWTRANAGNAGYNVSVVSGHSIQSFYVRRVGESASGLWGALSTCAGPAAPQPSTYAPRYIGRWAQLKTSPTTSYPGTGFVANIDGTALHADITEYGAEYIDVSVDNGAPRTVYLPSGSYRITLASGLSNTRHQVRLTRRNEGKFGRLEIRAYDLAGGQFAPPPAPTSANYMQFVGDSNTAGYGNAGTSCGDSAEFQNFSLSYAAKLARVFDAELEAVAISGIGVSRNMVGSDSYTMPARYDRSIESIPAAPAGAADPDGYRASGGRQAGVVYVQLGQNDFDSWQWSSPPDSATLGGAMTTLLGRIRLAQPSAKIIVGISPGITDAGNSWVPRTAMRRAFTAAVSFRRASGDNNVVFFELPELEASRRGIDLAGCFGHYTADYHTRIAADLTSFVQSYSGWAAKYPIVTAPVQTGNISWSAAGCTSQAGKSKFNVSLSGLSAGVIGEFSTDNVSWADANVGRNGYIVQTSVSAGGLQNFWARPKGYPEMAIWGALSACH